jgi:hypothetical protein
MGPICLPVTMRNSVPPSRDLRSSYQSRSLAVPSERRADASLNVKINKPCPRGFPSFLISCDGSPFTLSNRYVVLPAAAFGWCCTCRNATCRVKVAWLCSRHRMHVSALVFFLSDNCLECYRLTANCFFSVSSHDNYADLLASQSSFFS